MYDDKKYSPCYSGYTDDMQFNQLCELERNRHIAQHNVTELYSAYVNLYRNLIVLNPT